MYFHIDDLNSSVKSGDNRIRNFYDTFGFVVIRNFIHRNDRKALKFNYQNEFENKLNEYTLCAGLKNRLGLSGIRKIGFRKILEKFTRAPGVLFIPNFICNNKFMTNLFFSKQYVKIYDYFAGKDWIYMGSDAQKYVRGGGFSWHRDWFLKTPQTKIFFLLNPPPVIGGNFLLIPGGCNPDDIYSKNLSKASNWPMPNETPDGLSDRNFFPRVKNPRYIRSIKKSINVPHVSLKLKEGDALFFDQRNFHCLSGVYPKVDINMMSLLISKNPFHFRKNDPLLEKSTKQDLARNVVDLMVSERNHCRAESYGSEIFNHPFYKKYKNHFVHFFKKNRYGKYDKGMIKYGSDGSFLSRINFNFYKGVGSSHKLRYSKSPVSKKTYDKLSSGYSFDDYHLGLMSVKIDE